MGTKALVTFTDPKQAVHIELSFDGNPLVVLPLIIKAEIKPDDTHPDYYDSFWVSANFVYQCKLMNPEAYVYIHSDSQFFDRTEHGYDYLYLVSTADAVCIVEVASPDGYDEIIEGDKQWD